MDQNIKIEKQAYLEILWPFFLLHHHGIIVLVRKNAEVIILLRPSSPSLLLRNREKDYDMVNKAGILKTHTMPGQTIQDNSGGPPAPHARPIPHPLKALDHGVENGNGVLPGQGRHFLSLPQP